MKYPYATYKGKTLPIIPIELKMIEENMITREDIMALIDSVEILQNPETMRKIRQSDQDIRAGRVKKIESVKDMLDSPQYRLLEKYWLDHH